MLVSGFGTTLVWLNKRATGTMSVVVIAVLRKDKRFMDVSGGCKSTGGKALTPPLVNPISEKADEYKENENE
jgi:hypothetical protein